MNHKYIERVKEEGITRYYKCIECGAMSYGRTKVEHKEWCPAYARNE